MKGINSSRVSLAMSGTALFVALGGSALAVTQVTTSQIRNGAVTGAKLKNGAVSSNKIGKGAVTNAKLATGSVGTGKLATGAVTGPKLAPGAVGTANLAGGAVTSGQIGAGAVTAGKIGAAAVGSANIGAGAVTAATIGTGAVGSTQLGAGAVANGNLATNAVSSSKVLDGTLTASDVAPNTFLPATGTAVDSSELGGVGPAGFVRGTGRLMTGAFTLATGGSKELLELDFGHIQATCPGGTPTLTYNADLPGQSLVAWSVGLGGTDYTTSNDVTTPVSAPGAGTPDGVTWQSSYNDGSSTTLQVATAWTTDRVVAGTCVFTGQAITTYG